MGNKSSKTIEFGGHVYYVDRAIGKGAFGKVHLLFDKNAAAGEIPKYVLKRIEKHSTFEKKTSIPALFSETEILKSLNHPFSVNLHALLQNEDELYQVLDLMIGGDLDYWLNKRRHFSEDQARFYIANILLFLRYLHTHGIIHRDIKPENIMLDDKGYAHLTDLNVCKTVNRETGCALGWGGCAPYMAPEIMRNEYYDSRSDMWSVGLNLLLFLSGRLPWEVEAKDSIAAQLETLSVPQEWLKRSKGEASYEIMVKRILLERIHYPDERYVSSVAKDLLEHLICPVEQRYTVEQCMKHPFFEGVDWDAMLRKELPAPFVPNKEVNAEGYQVLEDQMGPKKKYPYLSDEQQARFAGWHWIRDAADPNIPTTLPKSSLFRTTASCIARQEAYIKAHPDQHHPAKKFDLMASGESVPLKATIHVARHGDGSSSSSSSSSSSPAASSSTTP